MSDKSFVTMGEMFADLPPESIARSDNDYREQVQKGENLRALREIVRLSQIDHAHTMGMDQMAYSKLERRSDIALRTLRRFVAQVGGELEILVRLPNQPPVRLVDLATTPAQVIDSITEPK